MTIIHKFKQDYNRYYPNQNIKWHKLITRPALRFLLFLRLGQKYKLFKIIQKLYGRKYGIEIECTSTSIDEGLELGHPFNITINKDAKIGKNVSITKGVTIGVEKGQCPTIEDNVRIGANSTISGGITIGENSIIAPNVFVNQNIPKNSIVTNQSILLHKKKEIL